MKRPRLLKARRAVIMRPCDELRPGFPALCICSLCSAGTRVTPQRPPPRSADVSPPYWHCSGSLPDLYIFLINNNIMEWPFSEKKKFKRIESKWPRPEVQASAQPTSLYWLFRCSRPNAHAWSRLSGLLEKALHNENRQKRSV